MKYKIFISVFRKAPLYILACFLFLTIKRTNAQVGWDGTFGGKITITKPSIGGPGGGGGGGGGGWNSGKKSSDDSAPPYIVIGKAYEKEAAKAFNKGVDAWKKGDWNEAIGHFKKAKAYDENNKKYEKALHDARGYREWDKGVEEAGNKNWDKAISRYIEALKYFPDDNILKNNILGCSYKKTLGLAEKYFNNGDWINAGVYYNVLWKNFDDNSSLVQKRYSECLTKIAGMKKSKLANPEFDSKLNEVKKSLPFVRRGW